MIYKPSKRRPSLDCAGAGDEDVIAGLQDTITSGAVKFFKRLDVFLVEVDSRVYHVEV